MNTDIQKAFHEAVRNNDIKTARRMIAAGADPNVANDKDVLPLSVALSHHDYACAEILMIFGARLTQQEDFYTADDTIVYLAKHNYLNLLRNALVLGGNPNARDADGRSAFEWAWDNHRHAPHCAACLIKHGSLYSQPLFLQAVYERKREIITAMLSAGVDVNMKDARGDTALHYAVRSNSVAIMRELIVAGCNIEARNHDNLTPLMLAIQKRRCEVASALMEVGADKHACGGESIEDMCSLYLTEIDGNNLRKIDWRTGMSRGWQFTGLQSKHLNKLLMDCCWNADIDLAIELIKSGANPDYQDSRGYTPLMLACAGGSLELVQYLLDQGADINACEYEKGWDAHCLAGWNNRTEICDFLIKKKYDK